jgi:hypothetical protein
MTRTWEELSAERKTLARTRGQNIIELRAQGKTYKDIGKIIGLSGSRCRDLELRHIRHLNFHKNYPLIKSWDESVRAAFAAKPPDNPNWARKHHNAIYYFCSRDKPTRKDFADLLYPSLKPCSETRPKSIGLRTRPFGMQRPAPINDRGPRDKRKGAQNALPFSLRGGHAPFILK